MLSLRIRRDGQERDVRVRSEATTAEKVGSIGAYPLVRVGKVIPGQPAEAAGLHDDDGIIAIDGKPIRAFAEILPIVEASGGKPLSFHVWRDGAALDLPVTARDSGAGLKVGLYAKTVTRKFGPLGAAREALRQTWTMTTQTFDVIGRLITARISPKTMMGPLGIAQASGDAARGGPLPLLYLVALISLQVGILNLFPLAPLDGGHLAILAIEGVARRDLSPVVKNWIMNAGALVIFLLIGLVLYSDISKIGFVQRLLQ
jgi:regulator of sigma E protease